MPGYLEQLPPETQLGTVFYDVHSQVHEMAETLDHIRTGSPEYQQAWKQSNIWLTPGFDLSCRSDARFLGSGSRPIVRRYISAEVDEQSHLLLSVADISDGDKPSVYNPYSVGGYRGNEREFPDGSYYASYAPNSSYTLLQSSDRYGKIDVDLAITDDEGNRSNELSGYFDDIPPRQIGDLSEQDHERLAIVSNGILSRLAAVRLILDGGSARDALTVLGHDVTYVVPHFSEATTTSLV